jgi:hypothetical protein
MTITTSSTRGSSTPITWTGHLDGSTSWALGGD